MRHVMLVGLLAPALASCGDDDCCSTAVDASTIDTSGGASLSEVALFPTTVNRDLDLLFVIDDSPSMLDKQTNLKNSFPAFINVLNTTTGGLPNLHIGVITTDVGVKGTDDASPGTSIGQVGAGGCASTGDAGRLQTNNTNLLVGNYISDVKNTDGTRTTNYTGTLSGVFSAIASVGANGCGFEQPLHALELALNNNVNNVGFLRPSARLGVILLADEDDCTISHSTMFGPDTTTLGPLQSFRCTRFGVTCDTGGTTPDEMNVVGPKAQCHSNEASTYMKPVAHYAQFLASLKQDARDIVFGAIVGAPTPFLVEPRTPPGGGDAVNAIGHSCMYTGPNGAEVADPPARIVDFANRLSQSTVGSVCSTDLSTTMTAMAQRMKNLVGDTCLTRPIAQPATCEAFDLDGGTETAIPACSTSSGMPCFRLVADSTSCPALPNQKVEIMRTSAPAPTTWTSVRCAL